jgi:hypothetical protein
VFYGMRETDGAGKTAQAHGPGGPAAPTTGVVITDAQGRVEWVSDAFTKHRLQPGRVAETAYRRLSAAETPGRPCHGELHSGERMRQRPFSATILNYKKNRAKLVSWTPRPFTTGPAS